MYQTKHNFTAGEFSPRMRGRTDYEKYKNACLLMKNAYAIPHGPVVNRAGTRFICEVKDSSKITRLLPFEFSEEQAYVLEMGDGYVRYLMNGGQILYGGIPYENSTPYGEGELFEIDYTQSADYLFLVHKYHAPATLTRTWHNVWEFSYIEFTGAPADWATMPTDFTPSSSPSATPSEDTPSSSPSSSVSDTPSTSASSSPSTSASGSPSSTNTPSASVSSSPSVTPSTSPSDSGSSSPSSSASEGTPSVSAEVPPGNFPSCVGFFEQRLMFAASPSSPQTIWASESADYFDFTGAGGSPIPDSDPYTYTISSDQVNKIQWLSPSAALFIGTMGGEWVMTGGSGNPVTPTSVRVVRESTRGSIKVKPVVVGDERLFVQRPGHSIRQISYVFETDSFNAFALDILAEHLLRSYSVVDWCYQQSPYSVVWAVRSDGVLVGCTYVKEHKVVAFHQHTTEGGYFESICSVPGDKEDEVYVIVRRTIGGETKRYIEKLEAAFDPGMDDNWYENAFYVDSGLSYSGAAVSAVTGLDHLEGQTVNILADGSVRPPKVVTDGTVSIGAPAASVVHVGLPIISDVQSVPLEVELEDGMTSSNMKRISEVVFEFLDSLGFQFGRDFDDLDQVAFRTPADELGEALDLFSGKKRVHWPRGYDRSQTVCFRQSAPLPMMITGYTARWEVER